MWKEKEIEAYLRKRLEADRFQHVLGVRETAINLAKHYNGEVEKAKIAALIHDCAKNMTDREMLEIVKSEGYGVDWVCEHSPQLLHGLAGAIIGKNIMLINDEDIFAAVRYHTTGRKNMSLLEKVIYLADYIEAGRNFPGVEDLRRLAFEDIDKAILSSLDSTIGYVISKGQLLHTDTIDARNYLICRD